MRRSEFSRLTGLTPAFLNSLARRDQFPFLRTAADRGGWGDYAPTDAYMTVLALALADAGATQEAAGHFIASQFERLVTAGLRLHPRSAADIYLGYASLVSRERDADGSMAKYEVARPLCGPLAKVLAEVKRLQVRRATSGVHSVVLVNASEHLRDLASRAADQGVSLSAGSGMPFFEAPER